MPLAVRADPRFLPVEVTTGSRQEVGLGARLVAAALYCPSGDFF